MSEILNIREELSNIGSSSRSSAKEQGRTLDSIQTAIDGVSGQIQSCSDRITASQEFLETSRIALRDIGQQVLNFVNSFPRDIRTILQKILRTNIQIYYLLLHFQNNLTPNPSMLSESNISFEDGLGRSRRLPYEWFQHWEVRSLCFVT